MNRTRVSSGHLQSHWSEVGRSQGHYCRRNCPSHVRTPSFRSEDTAMREVFLQFIPVKGGWVGSRPVRALRQSHLQEGETSGLRNPHIIPPTSAPDSLATRTPWWGKADWIMKGVGTTANCRLPAPFGTPGESAGQNFCQGRRIRKAGSHIEMMILSICIRTRMEKFEEV